MNEVVSTRFRGTWVLVLTFVITGSQVTAQSVWGATLSRSQIASAQLVPFQSTTFEFDPFFPVTPVPPGHIVTLTSVSFSMLDAGEIEDVVVTQGVLGGSNDFVRASGSANTTGPGFQASGSLTFFQSVTVPTTLTLESVAVIGAQVDPGDFALYTGSSSIEIDVGLNSIGNPSTLLGNGQISSFGQKNAEITGTLFYAYTVEVPEPSTISLALMSIAVVSCMALRRCTP